MKNYISINSFNYWVQDNETKEIFEFVNKWTIKDFKSVSLKMIAKHHLVDGFSPYAFQEFIKNKFNKNYSLIAMKAEHEGKQYFFNPDITSYGIEAMELSQEQIELLQSKTKARFEIFGWGVFLATKTKEAIEALKNGTYESFKNELTKLYKEKIELNKKVVVVEGKEEFLKNFCFSAMAAIRDYITQVLKIEDYKNSNLEICELRKQAVKILCPAAKTKNPTLKRKLILLASKNHFSNLFKNFETLQNEILELEKALCE